MRRAANRRPDHVLPLALPQRTVSVGLVCARRLSFVFVFFFAKGRDWPHRPTTTVVITIMIEKLATDWTRILALFFLTRLRNLLPTLRSLFS